MGEGKIKGNEEGKERRKRKGRRETRGEREGLIFCKNIGEIRQEINRFYWLQLRKAFFKQFLDF